MDRSTWPVRWFGVIVAASTAFTMSAPCGAEIVITEVMYDTTGVETSPHFGEWIEVFNTGPDDVDLTGWSIEKDNTIDGVGADLITLVQGSAILCPGLVSEGSGGQ